MKRIRFELTAEDSEKGRRSTIYECPFALAIKRLFGIESKHGVIIADVAYVRDADNVAHQFRMSRNSKERIFRYDKKNVPIKPARYEMYPLDEGEHHPTPYGPSTTHPEGGSQ
jgi:hypothetical protein